MVRVADFPLQGYVLVIRKGSVRNLCMGCFRSFLSKKPLRAVEDEGYLTITSF